MSFSCTMKTCLVKKYTKIGRIAAIGIAVIACMVISCGKTSPTDNMNAIIDTTEHKLFKTNSAEELQEIQFEMLNTMTTCLDKECNGYRFAEGSTEFDLVMERLRRYNIVYCNALRRFNSEIDITSKDENKRTKAIEILALMEAMEYCALTKPNDFSPTSDHDSGFNISARNIFPTQEEIDSINSKLPIPFEEAFLMGSKVEYNEQTKVETFYFDYTIEIEESWITDENIGKLKANMIDMLNAGSSKDKERLNAGMTYLYIYRSIEGKKLYEIRIDANDLK